MKNSKNNLVLTGLFLFVALGFVLAYVLKEESVDMTDTPVVPTRAEIKTDQEFFAKLKYEDGTSVSEEASKEVIYMMKDGAMVGVEPAAYYERNKNNQDALYDLAEALKNNKKGAIKLEPLTDLPEVYSRYKSIFYTQATDMNLVQEKIEKAVKQETQTEGDLIILTSIYERMEDFTKARNVRKMLCEKYGKSCEPSVLTKISGVVQGVGSEVLSGAQVKVLNNTDGALVSTDNKGAFAVELKSYPLQYVVLEIQKPGYQNRFIRFDVPFFAGEVYKKDLKDISLESA